MYIGMHSSANILCVFAFISLSFLFTERMIVGLLKIVQVLQG